MICQRDSLPLSALLACHRLVGLGMLVTMKYSLLCLFPLLLFALIPTFAIADDTASSGAGELDLSELRHLEIEIPRLKIQIRNSTDTKEATRRMLSGVAVKDLQQSRPTKDRLLLQMPGSVDSEVFLSLKLANLQSLKITSKHLQVDAQGLEIERSDLVSQKLSIVWRQNQGNLKLVGEEGLVQIQEGKGAIDIHSQNLRAKIETHAGDLSWDGFAGQLDLRQLQGRMQLRSQRDQISIRAHEGDLQLTGLQPKLQAYELKGSQKIQTKRGELSLQLQEDSRLRLEADDARVSVALPKNSGAYMNLGTEEGDLDYPNYLELKRFPNLKVAQGRLRGKLGGSVYVRNQKGSLKLNANL